MTQSVYEGGRRNAEGKIQEAVVKKDNVILNKTKSFALRIIKLYNYLKNEQNEFVLSKQILRSGTSIGANVREGNRGQTKPDFYSKLNIALKEAAETEYWLELLHESGYLTTDQFESINKDCSEIIALLVAITKTQKP